VTSSLSLSRLPHVSHEHTHLVLNRQRSSQPTNNIDENEECRFFCFFILLFGYPPIKRYRAKKQITGRFRTQGPNRRFRSQLIIKVQVQCQDWSDTRQRQRNLCTPEGEPWVSMGSIFLPLRPPSLCYPINYVDP
jgi:hypothetical protein